MDDFEKILREGAQRDANRLKPFLTGNTIPLQPVRIHDGTRVFLNYVQSLRGEYRTARPAVKDLLKETIIDPVVKEFIHASVYYQTLFAIIGKAGATDRDRGDIETYFDAIVTQYSEGTAERAQAETVRQNAIDALSRTVFPWS